VRLKAIAGARSFTGATPGGPSRWSSKRSAEWVLVNPNSSSKSHTITLTNRFRHGTSLLRWRPDKKPKQRTMVQLNQK
jgi:hypothetical protein